jgi:hypothetical protein
VPESPRSLQRHRKPPSLSIGPLAGNRTATDGMVKTCGTADALTTGAPPNAMVAAAVRTSG